jgi:hypothetical protein
MKAVTTTIITTIIIIITGNSGAAGGGVARCRLFAARPPCLPPKTSVPGRTSRLRQGGEQEE